MYSSQRGNWLDRLRSSKGFPIAENLDLDHFLHNPSPLSTSDTHKRAAGQPNATQISGVNVRDGDEEWFGNIMNNVLCELFNMGQPGDVPKFSSHKSSRKQTNPRVCIVGNANPPKMVVDNSVELKEENLSVVEEEMLGFSRSEVTVIDTSCAVWKFDKLVYRKKNVWKVKEKKGKSWSFIGRKKRKMENSGFDCNKKKAKVWGSHFSMSKDANDKDFFTQADERKKYQTDRSEEASKEKDFGYSHKKSRLSFSRLPKKLRKGGSSGIILRGTLTSKTSRKSIHKGHQNDPPKTTPKPF